MKNLIVSTVLFAASAAVGAETLTFHHVVLEWPEGFQAQLGENDLKMAGPNGEHVTALNFPFDDTASEEELQEKTATLREYAENEMPKSANEQGATVVRDLKKTDLDDQHTLYSIVSERDSEDGQQYLIEYFLVGVKGGAYFSIAGDGDAMPAIATFDPVFADVQWKE